MTRTLAIACLPCLILLRAGAGNSGKDWTLLDVPGAWEQTGGERFKKYDGIAWYRCHVKVPLGWKGDDLALTVQLIDNCHEAYFNGVKIGGQGEFPPRYRNGLSDRPASYTIAARHVRPGAYNHIAIRIYDDGGRGGFVGAPPILANDAQAIALKGKWLFRTGDDPAWAKQEPGVRGQDPATFSRIEDAAALARRMFPVKGAVKRLSPANALKLFKTPADLVIEQVLAEPVVRQPVFLNFDERGRMWVVQYLQYPNPAGLKILSRDAYWRIVYDKVPPPPPRHFRGKDKITIHEDIKGDGSFARQSTFLDGLNIVTAVERGRGGIWVLNPPYLLFYPDRNSDDIPDGDPVVHLAGFGLEDTHSVVNSLRWGPDGWLYGAQGSTVSGNVKRPGIDTKPVHSMGQLIWRYHPEKRRYEIFAEGGGNAFGVEIDSKGRIYSGHNGGNTRGFHYVQGGYYQKGFSKHGPISNPYAFGYFPDMKHPGTPRFTHTFVIYEGGALPARHDGKLFGVAPMLNHVVESEIKPRGSTFETRDIEVPITTSDSWFRPVDIKSGPDGALYVADWYDSQVNHYRNHEGQIDPATGRIYRLRDKNASPRKPRDLSKLSTRELIGLLGDDNRWTRQTALRLIGDRKDRSVIPTLTQMLRAETGQLALEALWALNLSGGFDEGMAGDALQHADPHVRLWAVRLLGDEGKVSPRVARALADLAKREPHIEVRSQLACTSRRLPTDAGLGIVRQLLTRSEDSDDVHMPLLLWWALEARAEKDHETLLRMLEDPAVWNTPMVERHIRERLMRRFAQAGGRMNLLIAARLLSRAATPAQAKQLLAGFEQAYAGRPLTGLPEELLTALARHGGGSLSLRLRLNDAAARDQALKLVADDRASRKQRLELIPILGEIKQPAGVPVLLRVLETSADADLCRAALGALLPFDDPRIAARVLAAHNQLPAEVRGAAQGLLASRKDWARDLLQAVDAGKIDKSAMALDMVRKLTIHRDDKIASLIDKHWGKVQGATTAEMSKQIDRLRGVIAAGAGSPYAGKKLFLASCAKCHVLFGRGGKIGPDLTTHKRDDLAGMLLSIVNPSAEIREGFETHLVLTHDGRALTGFLVDQDNRLVVLRTAEGQDVSLPRSAIEEMRVIPQSIMPEGLLTPLSDQQVRDLFAYLRSTQPLND
ncbi:MAG: c-type cytochrome [Planctomycetes bacterium]|nr:c-type cytochrome [Planctomycetota bacterium]